MVGATKMCEFNVFLKKGDEEEKIAENIVKVHTYNQGVELRDPLGVPLFIKNSIIENVDVMSEKLVLIDVSNNPKISEIFSEK